MHALVRSMWVCRAQSELGGNFKKMKSLSNRDFIPSTYQCGLTQKFTAMDKISNCHVEIRVTAAPIRNFRKRINSKRFLQHTMQSKINKVLVDTS